MLIRSARPTYGLCGETENSAVTETFAQLESPTTNSTPANGLSNSSLSLLAPAYVVFAGTQFWV